MVLRNYSTNLIVASKVVVAVNPFERGIGLLSRKQIPPSEGMWFPNCWIIHTVGMRVSIDVLFLNAQNRVINLRPGVRPNRVVAAYGAATVVELGVGALDATDVLVGDRLALEG